MAEQPAVWPVPPQPLRTCVMLGDVYKGRFSRQTNVLSQNPWASTPEPQTYFVSTARAAPESQGFLAMFPSANDVV